MELAVPRTVLAGGTSKAGAGKGVAPELAGAALVEDRVEMPGGAGAETPETDLQGAPEVALWMLQTLLSPGRDLKCYRHPVPRRHRRSHPSHGRCPGLTAMICRPLLRHVRYWSPASPLLVQAPPLRCQQVSSLEAFRLA